MCICAFVLAYYTSGMLVTIAMEKWVYQFSIDVMTGYVRREVELNDGDLDEDIESCAAALNMEIRIVATLLGYVIISLILMIIATDTHDRIIVTVGFVALIGILINLLFALILEYQHWPSIFRYKGVDSDSMIHFVEVFAEDDVPDMTLEADDGVNAEGLFELDDIVVMLIPPVGDIVYNPLI